MPSISCISPPTISRVSNLLNPGLLECAVLNAYIVYQFHHHTQRTGSTGRVIYDWRSRYLAFRMELATQLVGSFTSRKRKGRPNLSIDANLDPLNHSLGHFPVTAMRRYCVVCSRVRKHRKLPPKDYRHESTIACSHCNVALCVHTDRGCFRKYHTLMEYWK